MNTQIAKKTLLEMIDQIEDDELLNLYMKLLERETEKNSLQDVFSTTEADLVARAQDSLRSVAEGNTQPIEGFRQNIKWKSNQTTQYGILR